MRPTIRSRPRGRPNTGRFSEQNVLRRRSKEPPSRWDVLPARPNVDGETYVIAAAVADDETFHPAAFEGLEIPRARLWGDDGAQS
jgi:hypothetical protein